MRVQYEFWSNRNPWAPWVAEQAEKVRAQRQPVAQDNPWWEAQQQWSKAIETGLDAWRAQRDAAVEVLFETMYNAPGLQALSSRSDGGAGAQPADTPEHRALVQRELEALRGEFEQGGVAEAVLRAVFSVMRQTNTRADERHYRMALLLRRHRLVPDLGIAHYRAMVRRQAALMGLDAPAAVAAIPKLLAHASPEERHQAATAVRALLHIGDQEPAPAQQLLIAQVLALFGEGEEPVAAAGPASAAASGKAQAAPASASRRRGTGARRKT